MGALETNYTICFNPYEYDLNRMCSFIEVYKKSNELPILFGTFSVSKQINKQAHIQTDTRRPTKKKKKTIKEIP